MREKLAILYSVERHRLPLWLPVFIGCGIALYFAREAPAPLWQPAAGLLAVMALAFALRRVAVLRLVFAVLAAMLLGAAASALRLQAVAAPVLSDTVFFKNVEATVEDIQHKEKKVKLVLEKPVVETLAPAQTPKHLSITLRKLETKVAIGDRIRIPATLFPPPAPAMPGAYDFARIFYFDQLGAVGFSPRQPEVLSSFCSAKAGAESGSCSMLAHQQDDWQEKLTGLRLLIADHLVEHMGEEAGAIASALMVGEQSRVPEEVSDSMRASGIYHILSISGLHMALATGMIFWVVRLLLVAIPYTAHRWPTKKIAAIFGLLGGLAYLLLAGAPVPAVRSYIMVACVLVAVLCDRKGISMFSLGWAAILILLFMPESLFTASFQLSFAATLAIIALYERYGGLLFHANASLLGKCFLYFFGLMLTSLAASFYTTPLAIAHFNRMAIYGIFTNMLIVPLSSIWIMPFAMLVFLTMPLGLDGWPMAMLKLGFEWMMAVSRFFSGLPYANITLPPPNDAGLVLIVAGGLWFALWSSRMRFAGLAMLAAGLATIVLFKPYDMIISDDAKRVAYRSRQGQWIMLRGRADSFEAEIWLRMQGADSALLRKEENAPELECTKETCTIMREGKTVVSLKKQSPAYLCDMGANLLVGDQYLFCDDVAIDRAFLEKHGATALRFNPDRLQIDTAQARRGSWPWSKLALAPAEDDAKIPQE